MPGDGNSQPPEASHSLLIRKRDYWSGNHRPYRNCLHDAETDEKLVVWDVIDELIGDIQSGRVIRITAEPTDDVDTAGWWERTADHHYERVTEATDG